MPDAIPEKINEENSEEIDLSFLPDNEKIVWKSNGEVKYLDIIKFSLRTLIITNIVAVSICVVISILYFLYSPEFIPYLIWTLLIIYGGIILIALAISSPFAFIPLLKYKKTHSADELNPYRWFKILTTENIIFKEVDNPTAKWSAYQKECFKFEHDRITCPIEHVKHIIIRPDLLGYYSFLVYGKFEEEEEDVPSKKYRLLKWKLSSEEITEILPILFTMEKEEKLSLKINGIDERIAYGSLLVFFIVCSFFTTIASLGD